MSNKSRSRNLGCRAAIAFCAALVPVAANAQDAAINRIEAIERKIGGLQSPASAQLLLGIAQLKSGNKDGALKTFRAVKGDPKYERLANLWVLHARQV